MRIIWTSFMMLLLQQTVNMFCYRNVFIKKKQIIFSQELISGYHSSTLEFSSINAVEITQSIFHKCNSPDKTGGAVMCDAVLILTINTASFTDCSSGVSCGALYFNGENAKISTVCFSKCYSKEIDSFSLYCASYMRVSNNVCVSQCSSDEIEHYGPTLELSGSKGIFRGANISYNQQNMNHHLSSIVQFSKMTSNQFTYSNILNNSCYYMCYNTILKLEMNYCNFIYNNCTTSIFGLENSALSFNFGVIKSLPSNYFQGDSKIVTLIGDSSMFCFGSQITYERINSSYVQGNANQFGYSSVVTEDASTFSNEHCDVSLELVSTNGQYTLIFPNSASNIFAITLVSILFLAAIALFIVQDWISDHTNREIDSNDNILP
ncbi:hypothetical protein TRFO_43242 [Tritrichomonas foetus]|uniref:Transmembrane protein n=1 Tax=Tritrichomonas foetus TaxID=1144522 RepID=A0A1J4KRF1_9EUKA|nr:hypothetical protein TRFO_43242 [Tritrichomonas foetus]|eukprot:OHT13839.1 hypothetical protein TRFO_43242 [Tritrichomonas foetus]